MVELRATVRNKLGIHARPAAYLVKASTKFEAEITFEKEGLEVNGKSIMGVMMLAAENESDSRRIPLFAGMEKVKFRRPVVPGDQLRLELTMLQQRAGTCRLAGRALVGEELAAQAQILAVIRKVDGGAAG